VPRGIPVHLETGSVDPDQLHALLDQPAQGIRCRIWRSTTFLGRTSVPVKSEEHNVRWPHPARLRRGRAQAIDVEGLGPRNVTQVEDRRLAEEAFDGQFANRRSVRDGVPGRFDVRAGVPAQL